MKKRRSATLSSAAPPSAHASQTRRALLLAAGAFAGFARLGTSFGQTPSKIPRVGFLSGRGAPTATNPDPNGNFFRDELQKLGRIDGQNIHIEFRYARGSPDRARDLCTELVELKVDAIVIPYSPAIRMAQAATKTLPIVMVWTGDPVADGLIASLARPGGNITGVTRLMTDLSGKRLELLKEVIPSLTRVGYLFTHYPSRPEGAKQYDDAARALKIQVVLLPIELQNPDYKGAIQTAIAARVNALIVRRDALFLRDQMLIFDLITKARLPAVCDEAEEAAAGGLLSYGTSDEIAFRRAAVYVDKILKGAKPADLPVEQPMEFNLVVNLKTAKALGIKIPPTVMVRATRVIQ